MATVQHFSDDAFTPGSSVAEQTVPVIFEL